METRRHLFVIFLVILGVCAFSDARKCYSCDTVQDPNKDCNDAANYKEDECLSNDSSCSKVVQDGKVTRGCSNLVKTTKCQKNDATELCYCNGDYCNSARSLQSYPKYFASIILIPLLQFLLSQYKMTPGSGEKLLQLKSDLNLEPNTYNRL